jgi:hypothetical protein
MEQRCAREGEDVCGAAAAGGHLDVIQVRSAARHRTVCLDLLRSLLESLSGKR